MRGHAFKPGERLELTTREGVWIVEEVDGMLLTVSREGGAGSDGKDQAWTTAGQVRAVL